MAYRIQNLGKHKLALDLRGGGVIYLMPNEISQPLREELLQYNMHLPQWLAQRLVKRIDAKMSEVLEHEKRAAAQQKPAPVSQPPTATPAPPTAKEANKGADVKETKNSEDSLEDGSEVEKSRTRGRVKDSGPKTDR